MNRRQFISTSLLALPTYSLFANTFTAADDGTLSMVRGNVGYYTNRGGTIGVYLPGGKAEGGVVVDTQFPDQATAFLEYLRREGQLTQLSLLTNTHHHGDHTGGNGIIAPLAAQYVTHDTAKQNLIDSLAKNEKTGSLPLPTTTFDGSWSTNTPDGKEVVSLRHFGAAHTGGDAVVHFENADVAHLGDLLFNRRFPYIDPGAGGDILNWPETMKRIRRHYGKNTIYLFGHAADGYPVFGTSSDIKAFENYLNRLRKYVNKAFKNGTSLADLKAKTETVPGAPEWKFGERLRDVNLEVMHAALTAN